MNNSQRHHTEAAWQRAFAKQGMSVLKSRKNRKVRLDAVENGVGNGTVLYIRGKMSFASLTGDVYSSLHGRK